MIIPRGISPNIWAGRDGNKVVAIVSHTMQGTLATTTGWFANPASEVSAHFGIGRDGAILQFVDTANAAWANGVVKQPDTSLPWLMDAIAQGININNITVSIEHDDGGIIPAPPLTEAQYQSSLAVHIKLIDAFGIPVDRQHIIGHYQIDLVDKKNCPGPNFPFTRLLTDLKTHYATKAPKTPTPPTPLPPISVSNPLGLGVGGGVLAAMAAHGDAAQSDELYFVPKPNQRTDVTLCSIAWGNRYVYLSTPNPDGTWRIRTLKEI